MAKIKKLWKNLLESRRKECWKRDGKLVHKTESYKMSLLRSGKERFLHTKIHAEVTGMVEKTKLQTDSKHGNRRFPHSLQLQLLNI